MLGPEKLEARVPSAKIPEKLSDPLSKIGVRGPRDRDRREGPEASGDL